MKKNKRVLFGTGACALMVLLALAPAITSSEPILQTCGNNITSTKAKEAIIISIQIIDGFPKSTFEKLISKEEASAVEYLVKDLQEKFERAQTQEEVALLISNSLQELKVYDLLPKQFSSTLFQQLISGSLSLQERTQNMGKHPYYNRFCFLITSTPYHEELNAPLAIAYIILVAGIRLNNEKIVNLSLNLMRYSHDKPLRMTNRIIFSTDFNISTFGLYGKKFGEITAAPFYFYRIQGFNGICICLDKDRAYFLGYARSVIGPTDWFWG
jgi:hypothetical protein